MFDIDVCITHYALHHIQIYNFIKNKENQMQMESLFLIMRFLNCS
jgi:uncharacterized membrane protein YwzB